MLDSRFLLSLIVCFPLPLLSDRLIPRSLEALFSDSLCFFAPNSFFINACPSELLAPDALFFSLLLLSLVLNPALFSLFLPFPLLLLIFSFSDFFCAAVLLNRNAPPFLSFDTTLLDFLLSLDANGLLILTILFFPLFNEFTLVLLCFLRDFLLILLLSDALFLFPCCVVLFPVLPGGVLLVCSPDVLLLLPVVGVTSILVFRVLLLFVFLLILCVFASALSTNALASCLR